MSIEVKLFSFSKRDNSTKQPPDGTPSQTYDCILKEECGIVNPRLVIQDIGNPSQYNYAFIPGFGRYYWIREWTWILGRWECDLYADVLATFKDYIGNSTQYIERSSHSYDGNITDSLYPTIAIDDANMVNLGTPLGDTISNGVYVLGVINDKGGHGAVEYFVLSQSEFASLCAVLFAQNPVWYDISQITKSTPQDITEIALPAEVMKSLFNPMQYIVSCMFFSEGVDPPTASNDSIHFGWWDSGLTARKLGAGGTSYIYRAFTIPAHPQASDRGIFLNLSPYTRLIFNAGPFGYFPVDTTYFADSLTGSYRIGIDCITGEGTLHIHDDSGNTISVHRAQIGVPIKLAQITRDYLQLASNVVDTTASAVSGVSNTLKQVATGNILGGISSGAQATANVTNGIISSIRSAMPVLTAGGTGGSLYEINRVWTLTVQHFILAEEDNANRGRPLAQKRVIRQIPGYILVDDPDVETNGLSEETALIRQYMSGGFFYE